MSDNITADTKALLAMNQKEPSYVTASVLNRFLTSWRMMMSLAQKAGQTRVIIRPAMG